MINIVEAEKSFKDYLKSYDSSNGNIELKIRHTYGVVTASEYITKSLGLDEENIQLAKLIALLHDIGRFEQIKVTESYVDNKKFDHAKYGVEILFKDNLIRNFIKDDKYDDIIYKAIINHNKYKIEEGLNEEELLHAKIIRDADKLDNFRVKEEDKLENILSMKYDPNTIIYDGITRKVYEDFMDNKSILSADIVTQVDMWISYIAFIFDLNFKVSLKYVEEKGYIDKLIDRVEYRNEDTKQKMEQIRKCVKEYVINKVKDNSNNI